MLNNKQETINKGVVPPLSEILQFFNKSKNNLDRFNGETFKGLEDAICAEFEKYLKQRVLEDNPIDNWMPYFRGWVRNQNLSDIKQKYGVKTENPLKDFFK